MAFLAAFELVLGLFWNDCVVVSVDMYVAFEGLRGPFLL